MLTGEGKNLLNEDSIFEELSLYKVVETKKGKPVCLHNDGGVSAVIQFNGLNNTSFSESDFEVMAKRIQSTLDDIQNPNVSVQFLMVRDNQITDIDHYVENLPSFLQP
jgi:hypothetical protein